MSFSKKTIAKAEILFHTTNTIVCIALMIFLEGPKIALSDYANFPITEIIFKYWISVLAIGGFRNGKMKYAAVLLLGVVIWDNVPGTIENVLHNISAVGFFVAVAVAFFQMKRYRILGVLMILGTPLCVISLLYAELAAISLIIYYSMDRFFRIEKVKGSLA